MLKRVAVESVADAYLELLAARGVDCFFGNAGTDFAPILEAFAKRAAQGHVLPRPMTVPHEITAVAMAHGYAMVTGRPQVVMVHVTVGTANAMSGIMNASRVRVPILLTAGRTPLTEAGMVGTRDLAIHWAQEAFDQAGMVREFVKWDYELRFGSQLETVVDRALAIARSEPAGPAYLALPREVLASPLEQFTYSVPPRLSASGATAPAPPAVENAARILAAARNPILIATSSGGDGQAMGPLVALAEVLGMPVFEYRHTHVNFPQNHPLHAGYDPSSHLSHSDVVVAVESDVPWIPSVTAPPPDTTVIQIAQDPLFSRYPIRGFPVDVSMPGTPRLTLSALAEAVRAIGPDLRARNARRDRWEAEHRRLREAWLAAARRVEADRPIDMVWLSRCLGGVLDGQTLVVNEYDLNPTQICLTAPGTYFASPPVSGLGWGLGAALGAKLAAPEKTVICCVGDGAYIFGCPAAAHFVSRAYGLPVLFVVFNNRAWNAVKRAALTYAPEGWAVKTGCVPLSDIDPAPDYELFCQASGGYGERVEDPSVLPEALARALRVVRDERRQALLNVVCKKP